MSLTAGRTVYGGDAGNTAFCLRLVGINGRALEFMVLEESFERGEEHTEEGKAKCFRQGPCKEERSIFRKTVGGQWATSRTVEVWVRREFFRGFSGEPGGLLVCTSS